MVWTWRAELELRENAGGRPPVRRSSVRKTFHQSDLQQQEAMHGKGTRCLYLWEHSSSSFSPEKKLIVFLICWPTGFCSLALALAMVSSVLVKGNLTEMELGNQKGELSCSTTISGGIKAPNRRINRKESSVTGPPGDDVHCTSYKKLTTPATQPMSNRHHPKLSLFSNRLLFKTSPPSFFLFLHKITFFSFVCWTCL